MTSLNQPKDQPKVDRSFKAVLDVGIALTVLQWVLFIQLAWFS